MVFLLGVFLQGWEKHLRQLVELLIASNPALGFTSSRVRWAVVKPEDLVWIPCTHKAENNPL